MRIPTLFSFLIITSLFYSCSNQKTNLSGFDVADHIIPKIEGFEAQVITKGFGEWLSITKDPQGRLLVSPRHGLLLRFTIPNDGKGTFNVDTLDIGVTDCQGLLYEYGHLYMMGSNKEEIRGIHRVPDLDGQGNYGDPILMKEIPKNGDHSGHTLTKGPDGMIYFLTGNENVVPGEENEEYVTKNWKTDHLLPVKTIFAPHQGPPGGFVMRTDSLGENWQFHSYGFRNPYDMCFNQEGELFTFDSDMEWDFNLPWYRATRVNHIVSGGDYAWREGTAKRFDYYPDIWPAVVDIGRGSPTATSFAEGATFPEKYQRALFLGDWSYGKIYALHLQKDGSTYKGEPETFMTGQPLNITDMIVGDDGALYFVTGGNGTDTGLFRIVYSGSENTKSIIDSSGNDKTQAEDLFAIRHELEKWHFSNETEGLDLAFNYLGHSDRFIRNAARVILERHEIDKWIGKLEEAENYDAKTTLLTALIRCDSNNVYQETIVDAMNGIDFENLNENQQLGHLRLIALSLLRDKNMPVSYFRNRQQELLANYPAGSDPLNKELSRVLGFISTELGNGKDFIEKTFPLLESTKDQMQFLHYLEVMRLVPEGWTSEQRLAYQHWINYSKENLSGGSLFGYFIGEIEREFHTTLNSSEKRLIDKEEAKPLDANAEGPVKPRPQVRAVKSVFAKNKPITNWTIPDLDYSLELVTSPRNKSERNFNRGQRMFAQGQCYDCHYMLDKGGNFGPEMTLAGNSFSAGDLLKAIIHPSESINSRFQGTDFTLREDGFISGRLVGEENNELLVQIGFDPKNTERIPKSNVLYQEPAKVSEMPAGLINTMSRQEVLDLLYFIIEVAGKGKNELEIDVIEELPIFEKGDSCLIEIYNYSGEGKVYYSLDGSEPDENSLLYEAPFYIKKGRVVTAVAFNGQDTSAIKTRTIHAVDKENNGLNWSLYKNIADPYGKEPSKKPDATGVAYNFNVKNIIEDENNFLLIFEGFLEIEEEGEYTFYSFQDDNLQFFIDDEMLIEEIERSWGSRGEASIKLSKGKHPIKAKFFDKMAGESLLIEYEGPGILRREVPGSKLWRE